MKKMSLAKAMIAGGAVAFLTAISPLIADAGASDDRNTASQPQRADRAVTKCNGCWAEVGVDGTLIRGKKAVSATLVNDPGGYAVIFENRGKGCIWQATLADGTAVGTPLLGTISLALQSGNNKGVYIDTTDSDGAYANRAFMLIIHC